MDLGVRQIRTSGKGSGSIELTLPTDLRDLVGLPCRIILRDGSRPDIVLQPDLRRAHQAFSELWQAMATALLPGDAEIPAFPVGAFGFGLHPRGRGGDLPFLCWRDGLVLAAAAPHDPDAVSRTLAALGHAMAQGLSIDPALGFAFGAACGYLVAGVPPTSDGQEACDIAAVALHVTYPAPNWLASDLLGATGISGSGREYRRVRGRYHGRAVLVSCHAIADGSGRSFHGMDG